jgi:hypothetical protein
MVLEGFFFRMQTPLHWQKLLSLLFKDSESTIKMGNHNRQMIIKEYNMDIEMLRIENEYKRLTGKFYK